MKKLILLIVAAIAAASYLVYAYMNGDPMFGTLAKTMDDLPRNERLGSKRNIVVLGVDGREKDDDPGRSDTLFVVMFDPKVKMFRCCRFRVIPGCGSPGMAGIKSTMLMRSADTS